MPHARDDPLDIALRALARRDRTTHELGEQLSQRGVSPAERAETLRTLARLGYLDDARFANDRAASLAARGRGDAAIVVDLEQRGASREAIAAALDALPPERERVRALVAQLPGEPAKAARSLARRGFGDETIAAALDAMTKGEATVAKSLAE